MDKTDGEIAYETMADGRLTTEQIDALSEADRQRYLSDRIALSDARRAVDLRMIDRRARIDPSPEVASADAIAAYRRKRDASA